MASGPVILISSEDESESGTKVPITPSSASKKRKKPSFFSSDHGSDESLASGDGHESDSSLDGWLFPHRSKERRVSSEPVVEADENASEPIQSGKSDVLSAPSASQNLRDLISLMNDDCSPPGSVASHVDSMKSGSGDCHAVAQNDNSAPLSDPESESDNESPSSSLVDLGDMDDAMSDSHMNNESILATGAKEVPKTAECPKSPLIAEESRAAGSMNQVDTGDARYIACCGSEATFLDQRAAVQSDKSSEGVIQVPDSNFYGLKEEVRNAVFETFKIQNLHEWQLEMLQEHIYDEGCKKNALVHAPTSGGKTLVAIILLLRTMLLDSKDGLLVLPYVAIVTEKVHQLKQLAHKVSGFVVAEYAGSKGFFPIPKPKSSLRTLYVCTPEKATGVWKNLCIEGCRRDEIGLVAVDECHMINDGCRGAVIEELFVSLLRWSSVSMRIVALSATIGNPSAFRVFLGGGRATTCNIYNVTTRPTTIKEYLIVSGHPIPIVRSEEGRGEIRFSERGHDIIDEKTDAMLLDACKASTDDYEITIIAKLVFESIQKGDSVLVFCQTRKLCVTMCDLLTKSYLALLRADFQGGMNMSQTRREEIENQRRLLIGHLKCESKDMVDPVLLSGVSVGLGFHSAELHPTERLAIEDAFKRKIISALFCTTTLASGVNLPASRIIIRSPLCGKGLLSCAQYLQMTGRAGRTNMEVRPDSTPDSYIIVQPNDVERFEKMIEQHVQDLRSQLQEVSSHYQQCRTSQGRQDQKFSGITRIILNSLSMERVVLTFSELIDVYRMTLLYQSGRIRDIEGVRCVVFTLEPFLKELQVLLKHGHIQLLSSESSVTPVFRLKVVTTCRCDPVFSVSCSESNQFQAAFPATVNSSENNVKAVSSVDVEAFVDALAGSLFDCDESGVVLADYFMRLSSIATAASAGSLSISDGEKFVSEAANFEADMSLENPLAFLYLSITGSMSKPLILDAQFREQENVKNARAVDKKLARDFRKHPDFRILTKIGLSEGTLTEWVVGNPAVRNKFEFNEKLTRAWSALFVKDLLADPNQFETLCAEYGFDRPMALELSSILASRLQNLRNFSLRLSRFWWYPPLANHIARGLGQTCEAEIRPLLALRHVTIERAKNMIKMGLSTILDVAGVFPPTMLSDQVPHLSKWMAVEIVLHARMLVAEEAAMHEAESVDRRRLLN